MRVLTTDKGVVLVVIDRKEYIDKATNLLSQSTYRTIDKYPTNRLKAKLIMILRQLKMETGLEDYIYKYVYPTGCSSLTFYGLPKIPKANIPLRPIVSNRGSVTYGVAKALAKILKPLAERSPHHIHNTKYLVERVSNVTFQPEQCLCSYDVTAMFTSVQVDQAINIIWGPLEQDTSLHNRTALLVQNVIHLFGFCYTILIFSFQGQFYEQVEGTAMGSPVSPIVANLYVEHFEKTALRTAIPPRLWLRYVVDTFVIQQEEHKQNILDHINNVDPAIKFTMETTNRMEPYHS